RQRSRPGSTRRRVEGAHVPEQVLTVLAVLWQLSAGLSRLLGNDPGGDLGSERIGRRYFDQIVDLSTWSGIRRVAERERRMQRADLGVVGRGDELWDVDDDRREDIEDRGRRERTVVGAALSL